MEFVIHECNLNTGELRMAIYYFLYLISILLNQYTIFEIVNFNDIA